MKKRRETAEEKAMKERKSISIADQIFEQLERDILSGKYATLDEIEKYCRAELLDNKKERRPVVGFK